MQKIERYGVIALVFLLVTILAVSLWGESKDGGLFFWKKDGAKSDVVASAERPRPRLNGANGANGAARGPQAGAARREGLERPGAAGGLELSAPNAADVTPQPPREGFVSTDGAAQPRTLPTPAGGVGAPTAPVSPNQPAQFGAGVNGTNPTAIPVGPTTLVRDDPSRASNPPSAPLVAPRTIDAARTYVVKSGDTLGGIASRELGSSARWTEIQTLNGGLDPKRLREGMTLRLPVGAAVASGVPSSLPSPTVSSKSKPSAGSYAIRSGDTLSAIASRELGEAERWREIVALNPSLDPARLSVGTVIALPTGRATKSTVAAAPRLDDRQVVAYGPAPKGKSGVQ